jgi:hypothetical protein
MESGSSFLLLVLLIVTFAITLPFGVWRSRCRRYSLPWFLAVHIPIPVIFLLRTGGGFPWTSIPFYLCSTVLGQLAGGWLWRTPRSRVRM